jgi:hypothetical protein
LTDAASELDDCVDQLFVFGLGDFLREVVETQGLKGLAEELEGFRDEGELWHGS